MPEAEDFYNDKDEEVRCSTCLAPTVPGWDEREEENRNLYPHCYATPGCCEHNQFEGWDKIKKFIWG